MPSPKAHIALSAPFAVAGGMAGALIGEIIAPGMTLASACLGCLGGNILGVAAGLRTADKISEKMGREKPPRSSYIKASAFTVLLGTAGAFIGTMMLGGGGAIVGSASLKAFGAAVLGAVKALSAGSISGSAVGAIAGGAIGAGIGINVSEDLDQVVKETSKTPQAQKAGKNNQPYAMGR